MSTENHKPSAPLPDMTEAKTTRKAFERLCEIHPDLRENPMFRTLAWLAMIGEETVETTSRLMREDRRWF